MTTSAMPSSADRRRKTSAAARPSTAAARPPRRRSGRSRCGRATSAGRRAARRPAAGRPPRRCARRADRARARAGRSPGRSRGRGASSSSPSASAPQVSRQPVDQGPRHRGQRRRLAAGAVHDHGDLVREELGQARRQRTRARPRGGRGAGSAGPPVAVVAAAVGQLHDQFDAVRPQLAVEHVRPSHLLGQCGVTTRGYRHELTETGGVPVRIDRDRLSPSARRDGELIHGQPDPEALAFEHVSEATAGVRQFSLVAARICLPA